MKFRKRTQIEGFKIFLKVAFINYIVFSFTAWDLNAVNWSTFLRGLFSGLTFTWGILVLAVVQRIIKDEEKELKPPEEDAGSIWEKRLKEVHEEAQRQKEFRNTTKKSENNGR